MFCLENMFNFVDWLARIGNPYTTSEPAYNEPVGAKKIRYRELCNKQTEEKSCKYTLLLAFSKTKTNRSLNFSISDFLSNLFHKI